MIQIHKLVNLELAINLILVDKMVTKIKKIMQIFSSCKQILKIGVMDYQKFRDLLVTLLNNMYII